MSVYLKVLPAVLLDPDVLLVLGRKICSIVRETLILDHRMEEICTAIEREGRTLNEVLDRITISPFAAELDEAALACEKACSLLKAGIQLNLLVSDPERVSQALLLHNAIENQNRYIRKNGYRPVDRIRTIIVNLESEQMQRALLSLNLYPFFDDLKKAYERFDTLQLEHALVPKTTKLPTLRSTIALYGMLVDSLIANVRFENYQLLHRAELVITRMEAVVAEATETMVQRHKKLTETIANVAPEESMAL
ncbi:MAG: hypothetical protein JXA18_12865 [Chitinispirillaceae bacterium]|nr:hypothetical protein [Chitinispirillaceae bacterium]